MINAKKWREKNSMGKTRDFFKKIRDTKRTFDAKMGTIKDRNGMDLTEVKLLHGVRLCNPMDYTVYEIL